MREVVLLRRQGVSRAPAPRKLHSRPVWLAANPLRNPTVTLEARGLPAVSAKAFVSSRCPAGKMPAVCASRGRHTAFLQASVPFVVEGEVALFARGGL